MGYWLWCWIQTDDPVFRSKEAFRSPTYPDQVNAVMWEDLRLKADVSGEFLGVKAFVELKNARHIVEVEVRNTLPLSEDVARRVIFFFPD